MAVFDTLVPQQFDHRAIVLSDGVTALLPADAPPARAWLAARGYERIVFDFSGGISPFVEALSRRIDWPRRFGYALDGASRVVPALQEGLAFLDVPDAGGLVLDLQGFERAWAEDAAWSRAFLAGLSQLSRRHCACGRRLFAIVDVASEASAVSGDPEIARLDRLGPRDVAGQA